MIKLKVAIINFNTGNLRSIYNAIRKDAPLSQITLTRDPETILKSERIIIPGQGNSIESISILSKNLPLREVLLQSIKLKPVLGICMGQHILCQRTEEGSVRCLDLFRGSVERLSGGKFIPNVGWRAVVSTGSHPMLSNIPNSSEFYFSHSYFTGLDKLHTAAITLYGNKIFSSAMAKDNVFVTQFHPEKSSYIGSIMLFNFLRWKP